MQDVLWKVHRLLAHREREARVELASAEHRRDEADAAVRDVLAARDAGRTSDPSDVDDLWMCSQFALRIEMRRRTAEATATELRQTATKRRTTAVDAAREARQVERLAELGEERILEEDAARERKQLDEAAGQLWHRRSGR